MPRHFQDNPLASHSQTPLERLLEETFLVREQGSGIVSLHTPGMEFALKRLLILDVVGFPIMRYRYIVHRSGRRLALIAQALQVVVKEAAAQILKTPAA